MDADDLWVEETRSPPSPPPSSSYSGGRREGRGRGRGGRGGNSYRNNREDDFDTRGRQSERNDNYSDHSNRDDNTRYSSGRRGGGRGRRDDFDSRGRNNDKDDGEYDRGYSDSRKSMGSSDDNVSRRQNYGRDSQNDSHHNDRGFSDDRRGGRGRGRLVGLRGKSDTNESYNDSSFNRSHNDDFNDFDSGPSQSNVDWEETYEESNRFSNGDSSGPRGRGRSRVSFDNDNAEDRRGGGRGRGRSDDDSGFQNKDGNKENLDDKPRERYIPPEPTDDENVMFGNTISSGINFSKYDSINVKVSGENVPNAVSSFEECQLRKLILENVRKSGYTKPTPVQKYALPIICSGRDLMACAQTGSGKTAAFLLPIIHNLLTSSPDAKAGRPVDPQVIICSPTRELAIQIFEEARKFAHGSILKICIAYGGTVSYNQAANLTRGCNILVGTPGRLNDFIDKGIVTLSGIQYFVLDEADRMLDMGFLPAIEKMLEHESMTPIGERQTLMFSATFPEDIQILASKYLNNYLFLAVGIVGGACSDVEQTFYEVKRFEKRDKLMEVLSDIQSSEKELTLVFVEKKRNADFIAAYLSEHNLPTTSIHGDRLQSQREEALRDFKSGRMPILVATAVAARGLDIKNVSHVINYDMPNAIEEYVHRIGRTGRVGNRGRATSFFEPDDDRALAAPLAKILEQTGQTVPEFLNEHLNQGMRSYSRKDQEFGAQDWRNEEFSQGDGAQSVAKEDEWC